MTLEVNTPDVWTSDSGSSSRSANWHVHGIGILAALIVGGALWQTIVTLGMRQFPGMDGSCDAIIGWQMHLGYRPFSELVTPVPILYLLGAGWAFDFWGPSWDGLVKITAVYAVIMFAAQAALLVRVSVPIWKGVLVSGAIQWFTFVPISFWWYNQISASASGLFLTAAFVFLLNPRGTFEFVALVVTGWLLALSKVNDALVGWAGAALLLLIATRQWKRISIALLAVAALTATTLVAMKADVEGLVECLWAAGGTRLDDSTTSIFSGVLSSWEAPGIRPAAALLLAVILSRAVMAWRWRRCNSTSDNAVERNSTRLRISMVLLGCCGAAVSFLAMVTNREFKSGDLAPFASAVAAIVLLWPERLASRSTLRILHGVMLCLAMGLLVAQTSRIGLTRLRVRSAGYLTFYEDVPLISFQNAGFFKDAKISPRLVDVVNQLSAVVNDCQSVNGRARFFFGPRLEFAYPQFGQRPPLRVPACFKGFESEAYGLAFEDDRIDTCVFYHKDSACMSRDLRTRVVRDYIHVHRGDLDVYCNNGAELRRLIEHGAVQQD